MQKAFLCNLESLPDALNTTLFHPGKNKIQNGSRENNSKSAENVIPS